ncbi:MAG: hypothetical protein QME79_08795 [Bacillota bacterium]|nr:hypothetical protein [Bacillota bacterium]
MSALILALILLVLAVREARAPAPRLLLPHTPAAPPLLNATDPEPPPLDRLSRRYAGRDLILEVIYADPLLPADEVTGPVFRVVATYRPPSSASVAFPADLGFHAQLRTSDGRVRENLVWQEEVRRPEQVLGYLCCPPDDHQPLLTRHTRWVELSLVGVASRPLRFRWPVEGRGGGWRGGRPSDKIGP